MRKRLSSLIIIVALILAGMGWWYARTTQHTIPADSGTSLIAATSTITGVTATTSPYANETAAEDTAIAPPSAPDSVSGTAPRAETQEAGIPVAFKAGSTTYNTRITEGADVFALMEQLRKTDGFVFTSQNHPGMGQFVTSINGTENDGRNYWFLYVNGVSSPTGASATTLHAGDSVEWRYETSY